MATLQFSRNTKMFVEKDNVFWEIPIMDGFSFSQATNASEITLQEMEGPSGDSRRARKMFTDSYAPAEWSFAAYVRPFASVNGAVNGWEDTGSPNNHHSVEEVLWANFIANNTFTPSATTTAAAWALGVTPSATETIYDFNDSNKVLLGTYNLYFVLGGCNATTPFDYSAVDGQTIYKISDCVGNTASIDFEIDGISMINWSGFGRLIEEQATLDLTGQTLITEGAQASDTGNFIRNRLTTLALTNSQGGNFAATYDIVLTGGNITFDNGITYLTPETLCTVNQPLGHITGTRSVSGNFTAYLDTSANASADLFDDIITSTNVVTNSFGMTFSIGGSAAPRMEVDLPNCHLEVPQHGIEDTISLDTTFHALASDIAAADEATITYVGA